MRRYGNPKIPNQSYTRRPGAYGILIKNDQILLTFQDSPLPEFQLPGGGIDAGESPLRALHREVLEETGYSISQARRIGVYQRYTYMPDYDLMARKICHIYVAHACRQIAEPIEKDHENHWMEPAFAVELLASEGDASFLSRFLDL